jgi:DNA polymerase I-like protein with 3'-5' exonuclease and polymerase domains
MPFATKTGRNAPSSTAYIFGMPAGFRPLLKPGPGEVAVYFDWSSQEIGLAAAQSGDPALLRAFLWKDPTTGKSDPYVYFAMLAGVPKERARSVRKLYKTALLGVCYGMGAYSLAARLGIDLNSARTLLHQVEHLFPVFWNWMRAVISHARWYGRISTPFDKWTLQVGADTKQTTLRNFPMQGAGATIMRLTLIAATEEGLTIGGIVHDAFLLITTPEREADDTAHLLEIMSDATLKVCGIRIPVAATVIRYPDRYWDAGDTDACNFWFQMLELLEQAEALRGARNPLPEVVA